jgi:hypothetical protein
MVITTMQTNSWDLEPQSKDLNIDLHWRAHPPNLSTDRCRTRTPTVSWAASNDIKDIPTPLGSSQNKGVIVDVNRSGISMVGRLQARVARRSRCASTL